MPDPGFSLLRKAEIFVIIEFELLKDEGVLIVSPQGPLAAADFERIAAEADPYIEENGALKGLMILAEAFPGWQDFGALVAHFLFVRDHHQRIERVAAVTGDGFLSIMPAIVGHFVKAEVRHFATEDKDAAMRWLTGG